MTLEQYLNDCKKQIENSHKSRIRPSQNPYTENKLEDTKGEPPLFIGS